MKSGKTKEQTVKKDNDQDIKKKTKKLDIEESETFLNNSNSTSNSTKQISKNENSVLKASLNTQSVIKNDSEPRKMQAERSALLKDLSQSKLLNKYKTEEENKSFFTPEDTSKDTDSKKQAGVSSKKRNSCFIETTKSTNPTNYEFGGIYGAEPADCGVYGASSSNLVVENKSFISISIEKPIVESTIVSNSEATTEKTEDEMKNNEDQDDIGTKLEVENKFQENNDLETAQNNNNNV